MFEVSKLQAWEVHSLKVIITQGRPCPPNKRFANPNLYLQGTEPQKYMHTKTYGPRVAVRFVVYIRYINA